MSGKTNLTKKLLLLRLLLKLMFEFLDVVALKQNVMALYGFVFLIFKYFYFNNSFFFPLRTLYYVIWLYRFEILHMNCKNHRQHNGSDMFPFIY